MTLPPMHTPTQAVDTELYEPAHRGREREDWARLVCGGRRGFVPLFLLSAHAVRWQAHMPQLPHTAAISIALGKGASSFQRVRWRRWRAVAVA